MKRSTAILFLILGAAPASGQTYALDWRTQDGGGGTSSGAAYVMSSTIGQPDAGASIGGSYALSSGFWSVMSTATQPTPPPFLTPTPTPLGPTPTPTPGALVPAAGTWSAQAQLMLAALFCGAWFVHRATRKLRN